MRVRRVRADEVGRVRELRLRALLDAPSAFGRTYAEETSIPLAEFRTRFITAATFVAETDEGNWIGMVTTARWHGEDHVAGLFAMWVDGAHRRMGVGDALVRAVIEHAESEGVRAVRLHVTDGNDAAERLYRRHGFVETGERVRRDRDGAYEVGMERTVTGR